MSPPEGAHTLEYSTEDDEEESVCLDAMVESHQTLSELIRSPPGAKSGTILVGENGHPTNFI